VVPVFEPELRAGVKAGEERGCEIHSSDKLSTQALSAMAAAERDKLQMA
jgi:hypothetical protein